MYMPYGIYENDAILRRTGGAGMSQDQQRELILQAIDDAVAIRELVDPEFTHRTPEELERWVDETLSHGGDLSQLVCEVLERRRAPRQ
jgi:hypothetical protein